MASFGKRIDGPGGRRKIKRKPVSLHATAATMDGSRCILIEDLCLMGARVRGPELPAEGSEILLRSGDRAILGRVAWESGDRRGIVFGGWEAPARPEVAKFSIGIDARDSPPCPSISRPF